MLYPLYAHFKFDPDSRARIRREFPVTDIVWVVPEQIGGIFEYSRVLWPAVKKECLAQGLRISDPIHEIERSIENLKELKPRLIHVQHEFGLFGSKVPLIYFFPTWIKRLRTELPETKIIATAHTVLNGSKVPFLMPYLRRLWLEDTWGKLDGTIVHSQLQYETVCESGCKLVSVIPHFVHEHTKNILEKTVLINDSSEDPLVVVFGYLTPERAQDVAIESLSYLSVPVHLILAGGARRRADFRYLRKLKRQIRRLGLIDRVSITGFLDSAQLDSIFSQATLVLAPFRETAGSGSLAQAMSRGCAILTSDHPFNLELGQRVPECLAYFRSEDPQDCAAQMKKLLESLAERQKLSASVKMYAKKYSPQRIAELHVNFYKSLLK